MTGPDFGPRPELAWLPVKMLTVDPTYQRTMESRVSQRQIAQIVEAFRWACFGAVLAAPHGDGWRIIDGQHRVEAAKHLGIQTVPCIVVPDATVADQAQIFLSTNLLRSKVNSYAIFHARIAAGEQLALDTKALLDEAGLWISRANTMFKDLKPGQTLALKTIENVVKSGCKTSRQAVLACAKAFEGKTGGGNRGNAAGGYPGRANASRPHRRNPRMARPQIAGGAEKSIPAEGRCSAAGAGDHPGNQQSCSSGLRRERDRAAQPRAAYGRALT